MRYNYHQHTLGAISKSLIIRFHSFVLVAENIFTSKSPANSCIWDRFSAACEVHWITFPAPLLFVRCVSKRRTKFHRQVAILNRLTSLQTNNIKLKDVYRLIFNILRTFISSILFINVENFENIRNLIKQYLKQNIIDCSWYELEIEKQLLDIWNRCILKFEIMEILMWKLNISYLRWYLERSCINIPIYQF